MSRDVDPTGSPGAGDKPDDGLEGRPLSKAFQLSQAPAKAGAIAVRRSITGSILEPLRSPPAQDNTEDSQIPKEDHG